MKLLISACLLGIACRYDGESRPCAGIEKLAAKYEFVPFCPEIYGGLSTPRLPCEIVGERVIRRDGADMTAQYDRGAEQALLLCKKLGCNAALLKEKSPSCGSGVIYDGSFSGKLTNGDGVAAKLLKENGIKVYGESQIGEL